MFTVPDDQLERGSWEKTPSWLFWKPPFRREVYAFFGPRCRWEYSMDDRRSENKAEDMD
jgi:hypothetical protein